MRKSRFLLSLTLIFISANVFALQGTDNFDDGSLDPSKWTVSVLGTPALTVSESGGTLNFDKNTGTAGDGIVRVAWSLFPVYAHEDFSISIDFHIDSNIFDNPTNTYQNAGLSIQLYKNNSTANSVFYDFLYAYEQDSPSSYNYIQPYKIVNGTPTVVGVNHDAVEDANLAMRWDNSTKTMSFGLDGDWDAFSSLSLTDFNLVSGDYFSVVIGAYSLTASSVDSTMTADNFQLNTVPEPATMMLVSVCLLPLLRRMKK